MATTLLELFEGHPERWTQGTFARNRSGLGVFPHSDQAVCWCLKGAMFCFSNLLSTRQRLTESIEKLVPRLRRLKEESPHTDILTEFNDTSTFEQVVEVIKDAGV